MIDVILLLIIILGVVITAICWFYFAFEERDGGLLAYNVLATLILGGLITWMSLAASTLYERTYTYAPIAVVETGQAKYQVAHFEDGKILNVTERWKAWYPEGTRVKRGKVATGWAGGIYWVEQRDSFDLVKPGEE